MEEVELKPENAPEAEAEPVEASAPDAAEQTAIVSDPAPADQASAPPRDEAGEAAQAPDAGAGDTALIECVETAPQPEAGEAAAESEPGQVPADGDTALEPAETEPAVQSDQAPADRVPEAPQAEASEPAAPESVEAEAAAPNQASTETASATQSDQAPTDQVPEAPQAEASEAAAPESVEAEAAAQSDQAAAETASAAQSDAASADQVPEAPQVEASDAAAAESVEAEAAAPDQASAETASAVQSDQASADQASEAPQAETSDAEAAESVEAEAATRSGEALVDQPSEPESTAASAAEQMVLETQSIAEEDDTGLGAAIEAIVYVTEEPASPAQIAVALQRSEESVTRVLNELVAEYARSPHGIMIREVAGGFKMTTKPEHHDNIRAFVKSLKPPLKLSLAALETLATIAYKQPITAPEIMEIRGVQGAGVLKTLLDRKLIQTSGRKNVVGRPILYKTTKEFLVQFGLKDLAELPTLKEFEELRRLSIAEPETEAPEAESPAAEVPEAEAQPTEVDAAEAESTEAPQPGEPVGEESGEPAAEDQNA